MRRVGIYGGSFDPVHRGHLFAARLAVEWGLDEVRFVPAARPPHKSGHRMASPADRLDMLESALEGEPETGIIDIELEADGPRYTHETLARLRDAMAGAELSFLMGLDSLFDLPGWKEPERILEHHRIVVIDRPGLAVADADPDWVRRVTLVTGNPFAISSTEIRDRVAAGRSVRHLVTAGVDSIIRERGLYRNQEE